MVEKAYNEFKSEGILIGRKARGRRVPDSLFLPEWYEQSWDPWKDKKGERDPWTFSAPTIR
jgi:hypothetical protein